MVIEGGVIVAPVPCNAHLCQVFWEHPRGVCFTRPLAMAFHPLEDRPCGWHSTVVGEGVRICGA